MAKRRALGITETPNELTTDIDVAGPLGIVRLLRQSDAQIYNGYLGYPALTDDETVEKIARAIEWAGQSVGRDDTVVVISGAGTSGRIAMFVARAFNRVLAAAGRPANFTYLIAGGEPALIRAQEKAEDDPHQAWEDLQGAMAGRSRVFYIGVTCGLSAPYVAGQLWRLRDNSDARCILLGFNPEDCARDSHIERWHKTFRDVLRVIREREHCLVLNPIIGPEPVTGSTRMKGGSATKLILEVIFGMATAVSGLNGRDSRAEPVTRSEDVGASACPADVIRERLFEYERTRAAVYERTTAIGRLVEAGGRALSSGGHIYYIGAGSAGILGIVDASECPPTYGASFEDVRGFVAGGWETLLGSGHDLSSSGAAYRIGLGDFVAEKLDALNEKDLVVGLALREWDPQVEDVLRQARERARVAGVMVGGSGPPAGLDPDPFVAIGRVPESFVAGAPLFEEYAAKLVLNALTTGAHILAGKVYRNRMIDLRISNDKLFHRTIGIIQHITGVSLEQARRFLLRSIYQTDELAGAILNAPPSRHVEAATNGTKVVPKALVMAGSGASYAEAERAIHREPVVRAAIQKLKRR